MSKNAKKLVQCPQCEKSFTVQNIGPHVTAVHLKIRHHHCSDCDYQCSTSNALKAHFNSIHKEGSQRLHACDACEKQFKTSNNLIHHIRNIHIINCQEFKCDDCEYVTNNVQNLKHHKDIRWHSGRCCDATHPAVAVVRLREGEVKGLFLLHYWPAVYVCHYEGPNLVLK